MKARWDPTHAFPVKGADDAIFACTAEERSRVLGKELTVEEAKLHGRLVSAATERELSAWKKNEEFKPAHHGILSKSVVDNRRGSPGRWWQAKRT